jgi:hypothetical protein
MATHLEALKLASETMQGLVTINTALIGLTVTFRKDLLGDATVAQRIALVVTFVMLVISTTAALFTETNIVAGADSDKYSVFSDGIKIPASAAGAFFLAGVLGYCAVGVLALARRGKHVEERPHASRSKR